MKKDKTKILLALLPYWTPQIPPLGLACLKSYLSRRGYTVKTVDANIELEFNHIHSRYFDQLKEFIPPESRGNFYNIGNQVLQNHMMAHINVTQEDQYIQLVRELVYQTFFHQLEQSQAMQLNQIVADFFSAFEAYFTQLLEKEQPSVLGVSVYSATCAASVFAFKLCREKFPHIKTVMGGGIFADHLNRDSYNFQIFLKKIPFIDSLVIGEGERRFLDLLQGQDSGSANLDLAQAPVPDFSDFDLSRYPYLTAYVSRSCPFQCAFCSETVQWGAYRKKSAQQVARELDALSQTHRSQLFLLGDSLLNPVISGISESLLDVGPVYWDGYLRAGKDVCDTTNTLAWRRAGFYRARLGLESGSPRVLQLMGKRITPELIEQSVSALAYAGIKTTTYWVIGYPGETEEDFQQTLGLLEKLKNNIYEAECNPFNYFLSGQANSDEWAGANKSTRLYPQEADDMLMLPTWVLDVEPSRREIYRRVNRFTAHCRKLGIPNPYSLQEIDDADQRWKQLHKNAVPPLMEFKNIHSNIHECRDIKEMLMAEDVFEDDENWDF